MINVKTIYEELEEINVKTGEERDHLLYKELFIINECISEINDDDRKL